MASRASEKHRRWPLVAGIAYLSLAVGLFPGSVRALPVIQEVVYDGSGADADEAFTEIFGAPGTSLDGWTLVGINGDTGSAYRIIDLNGAIIPDDGMLVIATPDAAGAVLAQRDFVAAVDWQNGPDAVQLRNPQDHIVDALQYGDAGAFNAGEGQPAPTVPAGHSLSRDARGADTDDNLADFTPLEVPAPGAGPPHPGAELMVSIPDTSAGYGQTLLVPVRVTDTSGQGIVAGEVFVSYDRDLLRVRAVSTADSLLARDWTIVANVVAGIGTSTDTLKVVMATSDSVLAGAGALFEIRFDVADPRRPGFSPLGLEHVLFNDGTPAPLITPGGLRVVGADGVLTSRPEQIVPPATIAVEVTDADEDRDPEAQDRFEVRVSEGTQTEVLTVVETGASTGVFTGSIATTLAAPVAGNGVVETGPGRAIAFCYDDALGAAGLSAERCATTQVSAGCDGRIGITVVAQPGDTLRVRVVDPDLNRDPQVRETTGVIALNRATGESETITLTEVGASDSVFFGLVETVPEHGGPGDGALAVGRGDSIQVSYIDELPASGDRAEVVARSLVVDLFGDADANGRVQAFDASRVLAHALGLSLAELDSLAANVDSLAPFSAISPYDAALILQHRVGLRPRFPVQEAGAINHPQPETPSAAPKSNPEERLLVLQERDHHLSVWVSERSDIVSGELVLAGLEGQVEMAAELSHFLVVARSGEDGLRIVLAGAAPISGPGELLRVYPRAESGPGRLVRARFNDGRIAGRAPEAGRSRVVPADFALYPNRPNPFNPETAIRFDLPHSSVVRLRIFAVPGQQVRTLVAGELPAGMHQVVWDGRDDRGAKMGTGVYLCRLQASGFVRTRRMLLLK